MAEYLCASQVTIPSVEEVLRACNDMVNKWRGVALYNFVNYLIL
jgi:hypothetical protein